MKNITVFEFDEISEGTGDKQLNKTEFAELKQFILPKQAEETAAEEAEDGENVPIVRDASACMTLGAQNGKEVIRVKNYVGIVSLSGGTLIEILPKTADKGTREEIEFARKCVVEMLCASGNISYKSFQHANLDARRDMNLYEVFIRLFLDELNELYKKGLKAGYVLTEGNESFLKGKLLFQEHIKRNFAHKEKFYVGYETFSFDRVENRLIKATLLFLKGKSKDDRNRRDLRRMLLNFDEITPSQNYEGDFQRCAEGRTGREYEDILALCKVFLARKSFTMYGGTSEAVALLFPMEKLYEAYVAQEMEKALPGGWTLSAQNRGKFLFDYGRFPLRPDIVLTTKENVIILDTKWKRLNNDARNNYGISQADMYQMYAYHTRYQNVKKVVLLYPYYDGEIKINDYCADNPPVKIQIRFFDLYRYINRSGNSVSFSDCIFPEGDILAAD